MLNWPADGRSKKKLEIESSGNFLKEVDRLKYLGSCFCKRMKSHDDKNLEISEKIMIFRVKVTMACQRNRLSVIAFKCLK